MFPNECYPCLNSIQVWTKGGWVINYKIYSDHQLPYSPANFLTNPQIRTAT